MPANGKRRKGKQWNRSVSSVSASKNVPSSTSAAAISTAEIEKQLALPRSDTDTAQAVTAVTSTLNVNGANDNHSASAPSQYPNIDPNLVLTSEKRRGVYECDYCHSDISQSPRIRCAVCTDFDLCLNCFATVEYDQALQRIKNSSSAHQTVGGGGLINGVSIAGLGHDLSHGYRVCDSTRYPLFPTSRNLLLRGLGSTVEDKQVVKESCKPREKQKNTDDSIEVIIAVIDKDELSSNLNTTKKKVLKEDTVVSNTNKNGDVSNEDKNADLSNEENTRSVDAVSVSVKADREVSNGTLPLERFTLDSDPKNVWTIEEDLRLIDGIKCHGLGNWIDISETVSGAGSIGKTPKRCMERYLDDFLGRYGCILPPYLLTDQEETSASTILPSESKSDLNESEFSGDTKDGQTTIECDEGASISGGESTEIRSSKRRAVMMRSPNSNLFSIISRKKFKAVPTESIPMYTKLWPNPYLPEGTVLGQEVGRDQMYKAEQAFVKIISSLDNQEQVEAVRKEWAETKLLKPGGPTVLPIRPDDAATLPGAQLAGFMPRRGDFDIEWDNDAEQIVADMEFLPDEPVADKELKLKVLAIYNSKLNERKKRKQFVLSRKLYDYRSIQQEEQKLPRDERDLIYRMRLFERFHTPDEHQQFKADLLKAKRLRKEIAKLQMYRRIGIRTLAEAEMYELDKSRRAFHKKTQQYKASEETTGDGSAVISTSKTSGESVSASYWKQYRTTDRKERKSITRGVAGEENESSKVEQECRKSISLLEQDSCPESKTSNMNASTVVPSMPLTSIAAVLSLEAPISSTGLLVSEGSVNAMETLPDFHLLSSREVDLCQTLLLKPRQYLDIKRSLLQESLSQGLLDKNASKRSVFTIDAIRHGDIIDFMIRSGWISSTFASTVEKTRSLSPVAS